MINNIKIKSGILHDLLGKRNIKFDSGITVLWGRNGVGKSLLLKTIGNYCFVEQTGGGGWSKDNLFRFKFSNYDYKYNMKDKNLSNVYDFDKESKIDIDWSGNPCFYMHHDDMIDWTHIMGYSMGGSEWIEGIGKINDTVIKKFNYHPSTGQQIKGVAEMLLKITPPDLTIERSTFSSSRDIAEYVKTRKKEFKGEFKPTLLLDEIDSQLDLFNQIWFHEEIIPQLLKKYQIILASHSIFATKCANIIELDDSLQIVKNKIKNL